MEEAEAVRAEDDLLAIEGKGLVEGMLAYMNTII